MLERNSVAKIMQFMMFARLINNQRQLPKKIKPNVEKSYKNIIDDESIHMDGIYDVDESCILKSRFNNSKSKASSLF